MDTQAIGNLTRRVKNLDPKKLGRNSFTYIDIASIDRELKRIVSPQILSAAEAPSRARQQVEAGDILVSTVRPNLNAVARVGEEYNGEIASTGFCVIRPDPVKLDSAYASYFVQTKDFVSRLTRIATGASYPAVTDDDVFETEIPLLSLAEQRRIAALLARADRLRRLRRYALEISAGYLQAVFVEMFGDPMVANLDWECVTIEKIANKVTDGEHSTPRRAEAGIKLLSARNIQNGYIDLEAELDYIPYDEYVRISKRCNPEYGDILISCSGSVGRVSTVHLRESLSMVRSVALIKPDFVRVNSKYLEQYLLTPYSQQMIRSSINQSSQANLFIGQIANLPVLLPPLTLQERFAAIAQRHERLRAQQREALRQAEQLFAALLDKAFRGELTNQEMTLEDTKLEALHMH
jgi:type I restriction enzyme S subunit